jgi:hypothetical protein
MKPLFAIIAICLILIAIYAISHGDESVIYVHPKVDLYRDVILRQALKYHGELGATCGDGEPYFYRDGQKCNLLSSIKKWEVIL